MQEDRAQKELPCGSCTVNIPTTMEAVGSRDSASAEGCLSESEPVYVGEREGKWKRHNISSKRNIRRSHKKIPSRIG